MDVFSPIERSEIMRRVRSTNTRPEIIVRKLLAGTGFRYRLHAKSVQGCPDIASARRRIAIFVHGCFWHGHHCPAAKLPKSNFAYWRDKRTRNVARDKKNVRRLRSNGWRVLTVWECE